MGRRSAGAAPSSHYRSVTKHCKALRPISLSGRTVRLQRTLATSEPLGSVSLPPTRPAVWLQFWGRVGGNASLNCNKDRQGALAATGKGRVGGDACLSCYIGRQCALAARGAATIGQLRGQRSPHKSYGRWFRCTVAASAASEGQVSPTRPPCGLAAVLGGGWVGQFLQGSDGGQCAWTATGAGGRAVSRGQQLRPRCSGSEEWAGGRDSFSKATNGGQGALATRDAATGLFGEGDPSRGGRLRPKFSAEKSPLLYPTDLGHSCVTPEEAPPAPVGAKAARRHTWWA